LGLPTAPWLFVTGAIARFTDSGASLSPVIPLVICVAFSRVIGDPPGSYC